MWSTTDQDFEHKVGRVWVLPLRNRHLARIMLGRSDNTILEEKRKIYARIRNLSNFTKEIFLLRQLRSIKTKSVHIFLNKNKNQRGQAVVKFESEEDKERALDRKVKYFNYSLE